MRYKTTGIPIEDLEPPYAKIIPDRVQKLVELYKKNYIVYPWSREDEDEQIFEYRRTLRPSSYSYVIESIIGSEIPTSRAKEDENRNNNNYSRIIHQQDGRLKIKKGLKIKLDCEFCKGPITSYPHVFRFANYERFFCCTGCMSGYKQKYAGRIESIKRKFAENE